MIPSLNVTLTLRHAIDLPIVNSILVKNKIASSKS